MAKIKVTKPVEISSIHINIPSCPGCSHEHDIVPDRPVTRRGCSRQTGGFTVTVRPEIGYVTVHITFEGVDITNQCNITVSE